MTTYTFDVEGEWTGGRSGTGRLSSHGLSTDISIDSSMNGKGIGTNPDELLIASVQACYMMTLGIHLDLNKLTYKDVRVRSVGIVSDQDSLHFESITHHATILLEKEADDEKINSVKKIAQSAEAYCMIAKALKGNVEIAVHPTVVREGDR